MVTVDAAEALHVVVRAEQRRPLLTVPCQQADNQLQGPTGRWSPDAFIPAGTRRVNHARPGDVTEGYAADSSIAQLRDLAQRIADRTDALATGEQEAP